MKKKKVAKENLKEINIIYKKIEIIIYGSFFI